MGGVSASDPVIERLIAADKIRWYRKPNLRMLYLCLVPFCLCIESTSGFDSSMMNGMQALTPWQTFFNHPTGGSLGLLVACYNIGAVTSLPFIALLSDHVGRRWSIVFGSTVMIIGAVMQGLSKSLAMFVFARIFLGHGIVYAIVAGSALLGELGHPKERQFLGSLFNAFFGVGAVVGAGIVMRTRIIPNDWSWRLPSILQALPSTLQIAFAFTIPESPRWLVSKDRGEEALKILIKYHAEGDVTDRLPYAEYAEIRSALEIENTSRKRGYMELFQSRGMRRRALIAAMLGMFTQFSGNTLLSQYLVPILQSIGIGDSATQVKYNVGTQAWGLVVGVVLAVITPRYPRRRMYLLCSSLLVIVYTGWTIAQARQQITGSPVAGIAVLVMIFLYSPAYCIGYNALTYVYLVEIFPFYVRTKGITWFQFFGRSSNLFGSFLNPIGLENAKWKYLLVYVCWLCFEVVFIYLFFPETYGRTLEELTFLFEQQDKRDAVAKNALAAVEHIEMAHAEPGKNV
ncbi:hexose transporter-like protein [Pseudovirgaria hyperparasitica]|uniref:Hexose transporter-like protein n=1 Tax=Pseudovirgaria hyperparasitica TaxID=470096 RepID=A0A6A6W218_9PEZI|nr:hexose transporter-like protein [Pseudovirgaria hyperparasitica]KAF2756932.1 hexose transporter-like protein [Pseudovirgaria hyperparasitica]